MSLTSGRYNAGNRFGLHQHFLREVDPDFQRPDTSACYIPTRREVYLWPLPRLLPVLTHWFAQQTGPLVVSDEQRAAVYALLQQRPDHGDARLLQFFERSEP